MTKKKAQAIIACILAGMTWTQPVLGAPIQADPQAPSGRHPQVLETGNKLPLVQIAPPKDGLSHNQYRDFNVPEKGAILNNSYTLSKTQLVGYVQGNPNLAKGPARIILNEVTGSNLSRLNGFLEVAGQRADVILANPNGIAVNGGGFLNTARALLTTGKPGFDTQGRLDHFQVSGGLVTVEGKGLNGKDTDSLAILSRAAEINAGIWANRLQVVTGKNQVAADTLQAKPLETAASQDAPEFALDVAAVGGMYGDSIYLVGTEKGLGVNLAGKVQATGDLTVDVNGNLHVKQETAGGGNVTLQAENLENTGRISAGKNLTVQAARNIVNTSSLESKETSYLAAGQEIRNTGTIQTGNHLEMQGETIRQAGNLSAGLDKEKKVTEPGNIAIQAKRYQGEKGQVNAGGNVELKAEEVRLQDSYLYGGSNVSVTAGNADIRRAFLHGGKAVTVQAEAMPLEGNITSGGTVTIALKQDLTNENSEEKYGNIQAGGDALLSSQGSVRNREKLESGGTLVLHARKQVENSAEISGKNVDIEGENLHNTGLVAADRKASLKGKQIVNEAGGRIYGDNISLQANQVINRRDEAREKALAESVKRLREQEDILEQTVRTDVTAFHSEEEVQAYENRIQEASREYDRRKKQVDEEKQELDKTAPGTLAARENLSISAGTIRNSRDSLLYSGGTMELAASGDILNQGGRVESQGHMTLTAGSIRNENDLFSVKRVVGNLTDNPERIRIDQAGHPEQGQTFDKSEFSNLGSGYGAYHHGSYQEEKERAGYGIIQQRTREELENGEAPIPADLVGTRAPNYAYDDPIFQEMGVASMTTPRPANGDPAQAQWDQEYQKILDTLNEKIDAWNAQVRNHNASIGVVESLKIHNLTFVRTKSQTSHREVTESRPGVIGSGGTLEIQGNVTNENSQLASGGTLHIKGKLDNLAKENQAYTVTFGTTQGSYTYKRGWPHKSRRRGYKSRVFMTPQVEQSAPASLGISQVLDGSGQAPEKTEISQSQRQSVSHFLDPFGVSFTQAAQGKEQWQNLLNGSLYQVHPESTARYLMETDPRFTNRRQFLSSDYFFQQLQWDQDKVPKRLGDGFYEGMLIRQQILERTGKRYLEGYSDDENEFKALMDAGVLYAQKTGLKPGIALSEEQMAQLTSDMVWLEKRTITYEGKPYEVLVPRVYLRPNRELELKADGSLVSGKKLWVETKETIRNEGTLQGQQVILEGDSLKNQGILQGDDLFVHTREDLESTGTIRGKDRVELAADRNLTIRSTKDTLAHQDVLDRTAGIAAEGKDGVLFLQAGNNLEVTGAVLRNLGENGKTIFQAGSQLDLGTLALAAEKDMTQDSKNYLRTQRRTELGTTVETQGDIRLESGGDLKLRAANMASSQGEVALQAGGSISLEAGKAMAGDQYALSHKERGLVSRSSTETRTDEQHEAILGSTLSGKTVSAKAGRDFLMKGSGLVGEKDVKIQAGGRLSLDTVDQMDLSEQYQKTKSKGVMGAGMGIMIGSEKKSDASWSESHTQMGSTVGSLEGSVSLAGGETVDIQGSTVAAGKDVSIQGKEVRIRNDVETWKSREEQSYRRSGFTLSLGGDTLASLGKVYAPIHRAGEVQDPRLQTLYAMDAGLEAYDGIRDKGNAIHQMGEGKVSLGIRAGLDSTSSHSRSDAEVRSAKGSRIAGKENVSVRAEENLALTGSSLSGKNVRLEAGRDLTLEAAENTLERETSSSTRSAGAGVTLGVGKNHAGIGYDLYGNQGRENEKESRMTYEGSTVKAQEQLHTVSGRDTLLTGSRMEGRQVQVEAGRNLRLESLQDRESYDSRNTGGGISVSAGGGHVSGSGSAQKQTLLSDYESVTEQAGIYAGDQGFQIQAGSHTHLKGAVIHSDAPAEKNRLETGTLSWEDVENRASYKGSQIGMGMGAEVKQSTNIKIFPLNSQFSPEVKDEEHSKTKSGIAPGTILLKDSAKSKDLITLNRNLENTAARLEKIFDKGKIQEKQETAQVFQRIAHSYIGSLAGRVPKNTKKILNTFVDGITSYALNGNFIAGSGSTAFLEYMQHSMKKIKDPSVRLIAAGILGGTVGKILGGDTETGVSSTISTELYNHLYHIEQEAFADEMENAETNAEKYEIIEKYIEISSTNSENDPDDTKEVLEERVINELSKLTKYDNAGINFQVDENDSLHSNLNRAKDFLTLSQKSENLKKFIGDGVIMVTKDIIVDNKIVSPKAMVMIDTIDGTIQSYKNGDSIDDVMNKLAQEGAKVYSIYYAEHAIENYNIPKGVIVAGNILYLIYEDFK